MDDLLAGLNEAQRRAVTTTEGPVRVIAGAGSGKTRALAHRFAYLVGYLGIMPSNILCVTFTNKAANEMRQRIHALTGDNDAGYVNTFHGFCVSVLQEDASVISFPKSFLVLDNSDIDAMLSIIYEERNLSLRDMTFARARDLFEVRKTMTEPDYFHALVDLTPEELKLKYDLAEQTADILFYGYLYQQRKCFGLDYNDLIILVLEVFRRSPEVRLKWQKRIQYLMVDEFQDIDALQYRLMEELSAYHRNLFVVGDPDQTIYTWRGASVRFLLDFDQHFPGTTTIMMNDNYRSTPQICSVANSLIAKNENRIPKNLAAQRADGPLVIAHHEKSSQAEADWIAEHIEYLHAHGAAYRDICILYRAHYVTRSVEERLAAHQIPYTIYSGVQFFDRREVKDALSYLRMVQFHDDLSFHRIANVPKRNLGERRMRFLRNYADGTGMSLFEALRASLDSAIMKGTKAAQFVELIDRFTPQAEQRRVSELLSDLLEKSGYEDMLRTAGDQERLDNLAELRQSVYEYETTCGEEATIDHYLAHVALFSNLDAGMDADKVKLMTIHAAKGLEFPHVVLCSLDEGVLPARKTRTTEAMEEERRLAFVAITRAQQSLALTCADGTTHNGMPRYPSRFVFDIDQSLLDLTEPWEDSLVHDARVYYDFSTKRLSSAEARTVLTRGTRVAHPVFGAGTVVDVDTTEESYEVQFDRFDTPRTLSFNAKLQVEKA